MSVGSVQGWTEVGGMELTYPITPIMLILLWRRRLYGARRYDAITN